MPKLAESLIAHGAPILKGILENVVGGIPGRLAGAVVGELASSFGVEPTEEAIADAIEKNPEEATTIIQNMEADASRIAEAASNAAISYHQVLMKDASTEGWLASRWRPIFAVVYSLCYLIMAITICRAVWMNHMSAITGLAALAGFLIFFYSTGAAVLGVYVWKRSDEKMNG